MHMWACRWASHTTPAFCFSTKNLANISVFQAFCIVSVCGKLQFNSGPWVPRSLIHTHASLEKRLQECTETESEATSMQSLEFYNFLVLCVSSGKEREGKSGKLHSYSVSLMFLYIHWDSTQQRELMHFVQKDEPECIAVQGKFR